MSTLVWAHRGASAQAPENTMAAFRLAHEKGADGIEIDIATTKDGVVMVLHDDTVNRTYDGIGRIESFTYDEIRKLSSKGEHMPSLDEVLEFISSTDMSLNIEIKYGGQMYPHIEEKAIAQVQKYGLNDRIIYSSFNHYSLMDVKKIDSEAKIGLLYTGNLVAPWEYAKKIGADAIHPHYASIFTPNINAMCEKDGIDLNPWTIDDPAILKIAFMKKVHAVITNVPDVAIDIRKAFLEDE